MKNIVVMLIACYFVAYKVTAQETESKTATKYLKEVTVDWDKKLFSAPLPVDESFILAVHSDSKLPNELILIRYIDKGIFYFYEQPIFVSTQDKFDEAIAEVTKTIEKTTTKGLEVTKEVSQEYSGDPTKKYKNIRKYIVSPLRANFYYTLLDNATYIKAYDGENVNSVVKQGAYTNTYLSYQENNNRKVTAIIGASYIEARTREIRPFLGFRYHFLPINKTMQSKYYGEMHFDGNRGNRILSKLSLDVGLSLASIQDSIRNQYDLFGKTNLFTGFGYQLGDGLYISSGVLCYNYKDRSEPLKPKNIIKPAFYISLSFDWDFSKSLDSFKKVLGAP